MDHATPLTGVVTALGVAVLGGGVASLLRRRKLPPWLRRSNDWRYRGSAQIAAAIACLCQTVPRLLGWSNGITIAFGFGGGSLFAAAAAVLLWQSTQSARVAGGSHRGSTR